MDKYLINLYCWEVKETESSVCEKGAGKRKTLSYWVGRTLQQVVDNLFMRSPQATKTEEGMKGHPGNGKIIYS